MSRCTSTQLRYKASSKTGLYTGSGYLNGLPLSFAMAFLCICSELSAMESDRFPKAKITVSHLGEYPSFDFWRTSHWFEDFERPLAIKAGDTFAKNNLIYYFKTNIWITASGHFSTPTLKYVCKSLGLERLLFSVDYPYETIENGCGWWDNDAYNIKKALGGTQAYVDVGRENAKKLPRLGQFHDYDAHVT